MYEPPDRHPGKSKLDESKHKKRARRIAKKATRQARMSVCRIVLCAEYYTLFDILFMIRPEICIPRKLMGFVMNSRYLDV